MGVTSPRVSDSQEAPCPLHPTISLCFCTTFFPLYKNEKELTRKHSHFPSPDIYFSGSARRKLAPYTPDICIRPF